MQKRTEKIELNIVNEVLVDLKKIGKCEILYLTAELQPFSNQFKPDLFFDSMLKNQTLFIEFKFSINDSFKKNIYGNLLENKEFIMSSIETNFNYLFLTGTNIDNRVIENLGNKEIHLIDNIRDADSFYNAIVNFNKD